MEAGDHSLLLHVELRSFVSCLVEKNSVAEVSGAVLCRILVSMVVGPSFINDVILLNAFLLICTVIRKLT